MVKCTFCGREENPHKGTHLIKNAGTVLYFCSSKCQKNATKLKRDKRKIRWTDAFHETREKARARAKAAAEKLAAKTTTKNESIAKKESAQKPKTKKKTTKK